jgi:hypothetical protein
MFDTHVFVLIIIQAVFHAAWNFLSRKVKGNFPVMWIGLWIWSFLTFPIVIYIHVHASEPLELQPGLTLAFATGFIHAVYFITLSFGYSIGDVSVVYPIGRGSAVAISAVVEAFFLSSYFPAQIISFNGWVGILGVSIGVILIGVKFNNLAIVYKNGSFQFERTGSSVVYSPVKDEGKDDTEISMVTMAQGDVTKRKHEIDSPTAPAHTSGNGNTLNSIPEVNGDTVPSNVATALGLMNTDDEKANAKKRIITWPFDSAGESSCEFPIQGCFFGARCWGFDITLYCYRLYWSSILQMGSADVLVDHILLIKCVLYSFSLLEMS